MVAMTLYRSLQVSPTGERPFSAALDSLITDFGEREGNVPITLSLVRAGTEWPPNNSALTEREVENIINILRSGVEQLGISSAGIEQDGRVTNVSRIRIPLRIIEEIQLDEEETAERFVTETLEPIAARAEDADRIMEGLIKFFGHNGIAKKDTDRLDPRMSADVQYIVLTTRQFFLFVIVNLPDSLARRSRVPV